MTQLKLDNGKQVGIRLINESDSVAELTQLLNSAYSRLAKMGLNYVAASQNEDVTVSRISKAYKCFIATLDNEIIGTICLYKPKYSDKCKWYGNDFVAKIGQFAVLPKYQNLGIGDYILSAVEVEAKMMDSITELALDTAETAHHLVDYYKKRNYRYIETIKWDGAKYHSLILSKKLV